jgi:MoaA/NifB/PqqE/SkfB family radical SAM enzyme
MGCDYGGKPVKLLVNMTWRCQLECDYCLLSHIKINRHAKEHSWQEWGAAFVHHLPPGSSVDLAGGDPLLFWGLVEFLTHINKYGGIRWAITTNAIHTPMIDDLINNHPSGCALINISKHQGNNTKQVQDNIRRLKEAGFPVVINIVDHPKAGTWEGRVSSVIPYQSWKEGDALDGIKRECSSGVEHWVLDPSGDVFLCNVAMALGFSPLGNIFEDDIIPKPKVPFICEFGCSSCYTSVPDAWPVHSRVV